MEESSQPKTEELHDIDLETKKAQEEIKDILASLEKQRELFAVQTYQDVSEQKHHIENTKSSGPGL
jgi:hypothetical protein